MNMTKISHRYAVFGGNRDCKAVDFCKLGYILLNKAWISFLKKIVRKDRTRREGV